MFWLERNSIVTTSSNAVGRTSRQVRTNAPGALRGRSERPSRNDLRAPPR
jgi:hypothetical protein